MNSQSENEEFEFMAMAEEEAKRNKLLSAPSSPSRSSFGLGGIQAPPPQPDPYGDALEGGNTNLGLAGRAAMRPVKFAVDVATLLPAWGNAVAQGVQDRAPMQIPGNLVKATAAPVANLIGRPFQRPIQSTTTSFARAGMPSSPTPANTLGVDESAQLPESRYNQNVGPSVAEMAGTAVEAFSPIPSAGLIKPLGRLANAAVKAPITKAVDKTGELLQGAGLSQMNKVVSPLMRHERKANEPISRVIFKYGFDKNKDGGSSAMFESASGKLKELSQELRSHIKAGKDGGKRVDIYSEIDNAVNELKSQKGDNPQFYEFIKSLDEAANDLKESASFADKTGELDLLQAQAFKQYTGTKGKWLQTQKRKGNPLNTKETAESILSEKINRSLNDKIDNLAGGETAKINRQISEIIPAFEALGWRQIIDNRKANISLTDALGMMASVIDPKIAGVYALNKASKSGRIASGMYRLGEKLRTAKTPDEAAKIETFFRKKGLSEEQINELKGIVKEGEKPFLSSIQTDPNELIPRNKKGRPELNKPETFVKQEGDFKSPFGPATPEAPAKLDPMDDLFGPSRYNPNEPARGSIEDLAPPELAARKEAEAQRAVYEFNRQGRERALGLNQKPSQAAQGPELKILERPIKKTPTQEELFSHEDIERRRRLMFNYLKDKTGTDPFMSQVDKNLHLLGRREVPKIPIKPKEKPPEVEKIRRKYNGRRNARELTDIASLMHHGHDSWQTTTIRAEDAPKKFWLGGEEYTKGRTLYGKTRFVDYRGRAHLFSNDELIHMDPPEESVPF